MSSEQDLLRDAVEQRGVSKRQSVLQKLFAVWFDAFVYNQIWEDPRVDLQALKLDKEARVLTISSGGCNALNYLLENPGSVTAVDLNRHHIFLLNLKIAALKFLPTYEDFFAFFGYGKSERTIENYERFIAPELDDDTRRFWESNSLVGKLTHGRRINFFKKGGLYEHSRNGYFLRFFHKFARLVGSRPEEVLKAKTPEEQAELYEKYIAPFFDSALIKTIGKMPVTMFGLGIPPQQYDELAGSTEAGSMAPILRQRLEKLACHFPLQDNYFAWQAFARRYPAPHEGSLPPYLRPENYLAIRDGVERVSVHHASFTELLSRKPATSVDRYVLLDAQDWMTDEQLNDLWSEIGRTAAPGARVIFRTAGERSILEGRVSERFLERWTYLGDRSQELNGKDRSAIYGGFHIYELRP